MKISPYVFPGIKRTDLPKLSKTERRSKINPDSILKVVADSCGVTTQQILSKIRKKHIVEARHIFCAIMRSEFGYPYKEIGRINNGRDHTTAMHSVKTHKDRCETENGYREYTQLIINRIYSLY